VLKLGSGFLDGELRGGEQLAGELLTVAPQAPAAAA
jgi:hypothetical protein